MIPLPFADRVEAGQLLAREFEHRTLSRNAVVLGLARGGIPVAFALANQLRLPSDVIVARKLGVPWQPELAMGAIAGTARILNRRMIGELGIPDSEVEKVIAREQSEMLRQEALYRAGRRVAELNGQTVILVDDGLATGSTMIAAALSARSRKPADVFVGVPVGSKDAVDRLRAEADDVVCLAIPELFCAVGEWYRDFRQVSDDEVRHLLAEGHERRAESMISSTSI
jgi:putative phosphoribosyl transferase